ncbi:MAG TPA: hypothetical protein VM532_10180 [Burkholderiales bacterium]|jgi:hypothetical protein|nr:hypothetical protein [Burkholderiales bacterium]
MTSLKPIPELENLVRIGKLKAETVTYAEFNGLVASGEIRLTDAKQEAVSLAGRFDLTYNAAHALALAALRWHGYRSDNRYLVFQSLPHTLGISAALWRVLMKAHEKRNLAEYEGHLEIDIQFLNDLIAIAETVRNAVVKLPSPDVTK